MELLAPEFLARYDGQRVPRYTSYPTALQFVGDFPVETYAEWLAKLDPAVESASVYFHIPFCNVLCWYCGCHTKIVGTHKPVEGYIAALLREVDLVADQVSGRLPVRHVHWGGGTPTMIAPEEFRQVMERLRQRFAVTEDAEIAVEIDPRALTAPMAATLAACGVNRASLGVQDFDPAVQKAVHRSQPLATTQRALDWLRDGGIRHINLDLMYGLPEQSEETCRRSAETALGLGPDRLAVFGYAHVPWMRPHQKLLKEERLPDGPARWRQFAVLSATLRAGGFQPIGLDHFARADDELALAQREGRLYRNFQGYTTDAAGVLLGFGASSIGAMPDGYVQNEPDIAAYGETVQAGRLPVRKGLRLAGEDALRRDLIVRLMCDLEVDLAAVAARHRVAPAVFAADLPRLEPLVADGLAQVDGWRVRVPESARPLVRIVAAAFDPYLQEIQASGMARHSRAI